MLHIAAALVTVGLVGYAIVCMMRSKSSAYRTVAFAIVVAAIFEVSTGVILIGLSPELSVTKVGAHIGFYLGACLITEVALFVRARVPAWTS